MAKSKKDKKTEYDLSYALAKLIWLPEKAFGQTWDDVVSIDEHIKTFSDLLKRGADPTVFIRIKAIMQALPLKDS